MSLDILRNISYIKFMRRRHFKITISLPALLVTSAQLFSQTVIITDDAIQNALSSHETRHLSRAFIQQLNTQAAEPALDQLLSRQDMDILQKEAVLLRVTTSLRNQTESQANKELLKRLTTYNSQLVRTHHDDPRHTLPAFNIAVSARGTLNEWQFRQHRQSLIDMLGADVPIAVEQLPAADVTVNAAHSLSLAQQQQLHTLLLALPQATASEHPITNRLLAATSTAVGDITTLQHILTALPTADTLRYLHKARTNPDLSSEQQFDILQKALTHPDDVVVSVALQDLSRLTTKTATDLPDRLLINVIDLLLNLLGHEELSSSAALALSQITTDEQLSTYVQSSNDAIRQAFTVQQQLINQLRGM